jgi:hypothetical protein
MKTMSEDIKKCLYAVLFAAGRCPECGSRKLTWHADTKNYGGVQDGRISMREVGPIFFLGCDNCSKTIRVTEGDKVAALLTGLQASTEPAAARPLDYNPDMGEFGMVVTPEGGATRLEGKPGDPGHETVSRVLETIMKAKNRKPRGP